MFSICVRCNCNYRDGRRWTSASNRIALLFVIDSPADTCCTWLHYCVGMRQIRPHPFTPSVWIKTSFCWKLRHLLVSARRAKLLQNMLRFYLCFCMTLLSVALLVEFAFFKRHVKLSVLKSFGAERTCRPIRINVICIIQLSLKLNNYTVTHKNTWNSNKRVHLFLQLHETIRQYTF